MKKLSRSTAITLAVAASLLALTSLAQPHQPPGQGRPILPMNPHAAPGQMSPPSGHGPVEGHTGENEGSLTGEHGGHELGPMNWVYGLFGEKADIAEPNLFYRKPGMPIPFLANLINFGILLFLIGRFGAKPTADALQKRKETLSRDIDEAAKVKAEAEKRLSEYETKLAKIDQDVERIRKDYAEQGRLDKERIIREAKEKRERMKKDAQFLLEQEAKGAQQSLLQQTVEAAAAAAEAKVKQTLTAQDQERLATEYLAELGRAVKGEARGAA